ncbi:hypothetical protein BZA70DRAFT_165223 [Myxozyma melibiosi]|uniref:RRM domain-containing protein n=1 Tax=Myxozyma melibiosi TaxID=54550 RepID=A0ABR1F8Y4_9ASCO
MADDYNYEIDIYDDENDTSSAPQTSANTTAGHDDDVEIDAAFGDESKQQVQQPSGGKWHVTVPHPQPDNRPVDQYATSSLVIADLDWWTSEEDVRGWSAQANVEYELKDITFNEHKANGKSRGAVYMEFISPQAATAVKTFLGGAPELQRFTVTYHNPNSNPFKMVHKDSGPRREMNGGMNHQQMGGGMNNNMRGGMGMRGRGGYMNNRGGYNNNRGGGGGGGPGGMPGMYNPNMNMGFNGMPMNVFGFQGGRGGMQMNNMRGGMGNGRGRGGMEGGGYNQMMGGGFGGFPPQGFPQPHFNPAFFPGQDGGQGGWQNDGNPHGNKRQRGPD